MNMAVIMGFVLFVKQAACTANVLTPEQQERVAYLEVEIARCMHEKDQAQEERVQNDARIMQHKITPVSEIEYLKLNRNREYLRIADTHVNKKIRRAQAEIDMINGKVNSPGDHITVEHPVKPPKSSRDYNIPNEGDIEYFTNETIDSQGRVCRRTDIRIGGAPAELPVKPQSAQQPQQPQQNVPEDQKKNTNRCTMFTVTTRRVMWFIAIVAIASIAPIIYYIQKS